MVSTSTTKQWIIQTNQNKGGQNIDDDTLTSRADLVIGRADSSDAINPQSTDWGVVRAGGYQFNTYY